MFGGAGSCWWGWADGDGNGILFATHLCALVGWGLPLDCNQTYWLHFINLGAAVIASRKRSELVIGLNLSLVKTIKSVPILFKQSCHYGTSPQNILVSFHHHHVLSVSRKCSFFVQILLTKCVFIRASLHLRHFAPGDDSSHSWFLTSYSVVKTLHIVFSISFSCIRERQQTRLEILSEAINMTLTAWEHLAVLGLVYIYPTLWSCYTFILIGEKRQHER